jgi:PKD repeat protein
MKKPIGKIMAVGVILLCLGATAVVSAKQAPQTMVQMPKPVNRDWSDNFDSYMNGQYLDGGSDDGGWKGWDNVSSAAGRVSDAQYRSAPYSDQIWDLSDNVHEYSGYTTGKWVYTAWQYVPDNFSGITYFILLSDYTDGAGQNNKWALQMHFDSELGLVESEFDTIDLPLIKARWVEIRVVIDLDSDMMDVYYDNELLISKAWTAGPNNQGDGVLNIAAVDLYASGASPVYYDDISLVPYTDSLTVDASGPYTETIGVPIDFSSAAHGGTSPYTFAWDFGDGNSSPDQNPSHAYANNGLYTVTLTVTDSAQNTAQDTTTVNITGYIPKPTLVLSSLTGGTGIVSAVIKNTGDGAATNVQWTITVTGGIFHRINKTFTGNIATFDPGADQTITTTGKIFGLGAITVAVSATCNEGSSSTLSGTGKIFIIFIKITG